MQEAAWRTRQPHVPYAPTRYRNRTRTQSDVTQHHAPPRKLHHGGHRRPFAARITGFHDFTRRLGPSAASAWAIDDHRRLLATSVIARGDTRPSRHLDVTSEVTQLFQLSSVRKVSSTELTKVPIKSLMSLVIDPFEDQWGFRGYIADAGDETIIVYSSGLRKWWKLRMLHRPEIPRVQSTDLAVSRVNSILYMTGHHSHDLFSINLKRISTDKLLGTSSHEVQNVTVIWLGKKLGSSVGLFSDLKGGLHYFMTSERASVRWNTKLPLNAQSHSVLVQNDDVPCITDYIMDARRNVWGLINSKCPGATKKNTSSNSTLKSRTIKIQKYYSAMQ